MTCQRWVRFFIPLCHDWRLLFKLIEIKSSAQYYLTIYLIQLKYLFYIWKHSTYRTRIFTPYTRTNLKNKLKECKQKGYLKQPPPRYLFSIWNTVSRISPSCSINFNRSVNVILFVVVITIVFVESLLLHIISV